MGQSSSAAGNQTRRESAGGGGQRSKPPISYLAATSENEEHRHPNTAEFSFEETRWSQTDHISDLPDECLSCIFQYLTVGERNHCSLVCKRWLRVEGQSRHRLSLKAQSDLLPQISVIFSRFDAVTKLALRCDRRSSSVGDDALTMISVQCRRLTRLKLRACREVTDAGMEAFAKNCVSLKKLSCGSCTFGSQGINAVLDNCPALEELSVKRLGGLTEGTTSEPIGPGLASASLRVICLKKLYSARSFGPLITGCKSLKTLKLIRCSGDCDKLLESVPDRIVEIHLERIQVSDTGLAAISNCSDLEIFHLVKTPECSNLGLTSIAEKCRMLRKLHIDGWKANRIGDEGLVAVGKNCPNLQELVLIGVNPTKLSLEMLASNCLNLERLAFCGSDTVGDPEIFCIASKCIALKKLCIKSCPVSDHGMGALANGCPKLVKVKVKRCRGVTCEGAGWLRSSRESLAVNLDSGVNEYPDVSTSDAGRGVQEAVIENGALEPPGMVPNFASSSSTGRSNSFKARLGILSGRNLACSLRRWSNGMSSSRN